MMYFWVKATDDRGEKIMLRLKTGDFGKSVIVEVQPRGTEPKRKRGL